MRKKGDVEPKGLCVDGDKPLLQEGIKAILRGGLPGVTLINAGLQNGPAPQLLLLCVANPSKIKQLMQEYRGRYPDIRTILLYDDFRAVDMFPCLALGCCCVVKSTLTKEELLECIRMVENSLFLCDRELAGQFLLEAEKYHRFVDLMREEVRLDVPTKREIEIAKGILAGLDNEELGKRLYLSPGTVKNNIAMILEKYSFQSRAQIISLLAL